MTRRTPGVARLRLDELTIEGSSRAGEESWFRVQPPGIGLDVGRGAHRLIGVRELFLSHGHLDHAIGLPYLLSQRSLQGLGATRVHCPGPVVEPLASLVAAAEQLEERSYDCRIVPLAPGDRVEIGREFEIEAFATDHVVPSLGYHLWRRKTRLAKRFRGASEERIVRLKREGIEVTEIREELWLSYCGDTGPGVFASEPRLGEARVLLLECTFLSPTLPERANRYGHLHFEDLVTRRGELSNSAIVLHHLSRRHRLAELRRQIDQRLPELAERIHLLGGEGETG